ncbi:MAG: [acyl-carrier-protein] S-malonyltransferase [Candidatus Pelagibacter sp.]|nr:[acyl-carrier-protein] S-malonyltransferase [Candidatus Pelagibacter sp.]RPG11018.1 MAG: [acyl-carrier-protein] S-malonyltransferase [Pelagibacteraceae bacterium TMED170]
MKALLFPGQGSQAIGMGLEFYKNFKVVKDIFKAADNKLNFSISKIILEGPDSELKLTKNTQPAILVVSYSIYMVLKKEFNTELSNFKFFAGHSLGEYSALVCAEALSFEDALFLLHERGKAMQDAVPVGKGGMLAVLGSSINEINNYISELKNKEVCEIANDNAEGQTIVSGDIKSINNLQEILKKNKKKSIVLPVSAPFHCSLMKSAAKIMSEKIYSVKFKKPKFEIINNVNASIEKSPENIKNLLIEQIYSKVKWRESVLYMANNGVSEFIEIGPGKVLSGLIKRIIKNATSNSVNSVEDIKNIFK